MTDVEFFVPDVPSESAEQRYAELARWCHCAVPAPEDRVYSIGFGHNGEHWTATVGQQLRGERIHRRKLRAGEYRETSEPLSDPATVLAIFPGSPWMVVTNALPVTALVSWWANPFMAGVPKSVTHFRQ
jgi:hypothetical protein